MDNLKQRIVTALKKTWEQINPDSSNPFIAPCISTMCCIKLYGEDEEAEKAYMAMTEPAQQQLLCEVFPEWYPIQGDPLGQGYPIIPRLPRNDDNSDSNAK